ncbi:MAG: branched-chain amino acid transporter [Microcoleus sp. SIO2G3]|nr:branched-chain amino acid transporter [Microcoleus sp. SIO2G3]
MNIWLIIVLTGLGNYLMRSVGVLVALKSLQARWLNHVPFAVILVMTISSINNLSGTTQETLAALVASVVVIAASLKKLPLVLCIAIGCIVFGILIGS